MNLEYSIIDKLLLRTHLDEIIYLRGQIDYMISKWEEVPIVHRLSIHYVVNNLMYKEDMFRMDEDKIFRSFGIEEVKRRLRTDRDRLLNMLKNIIDLSEIVSEIRNRKLNDCL